MLCSNNSKNGSHCGYNYPPSPITHPGPASFLWYHLYFSTKHGQLQLSWMMVCSGLLNWLARESVLLKDWTNYDVASLQLGRKAKKDLGSCLCYLQLGRNNPFHRGINWGTAEEVSLDSGNSGPTVSVCLALGWCNSPQGKRAFRRVKVGRQEEKKCSSGKPAGWDPVA